VVYFIFCGQCLFNIDETNPSLDPRKLDGVFEHVSKFASHFYTLILKDAIARLPQIYGVIVEKSFGMNAFITWFMLTAGCYARIFTTLQEVKDPQVLAMYILSACLNSIMVILSFVYPGGSSKRSEEKDGETTVKKTN